MKNTIGSAMNNNRNKTIANMINSVIPNELIMHSMSKRWIYPRTEYPCTLILRPAGVVVCFMTRDVLWKFPAG